VLQFLKDAGLKNKLVLSPDTVLTDFESAAIGAYQYHFPNIKVIGCFFHFGQSLYRKIVDIGLKS